MSHYTNFAFEGGGVNGVAYCGAIREFNDSYDPRFSDKAVNFAGSSVGSIIAAGLAAGASHDYIERKMRSIDFEAFKDESSFCVSNINRLMSEYGFYKGDAVEQFLGDMMHDLTGDADVKFSGLPKNLVVTGTEVTDAGCVTRYFSRVTQPDMPVKRACRISSSYPLFFRSVEYHGRRWVDGGLLYNYPIGVFDTPRYVRRAVDIAPRSSTVTTLHRTASMLTGTHKHGGSDGGAHKTQNMHDSKKSPIETVKTLDYFNRDTLGFKLITTTEADDYVNYRYEDEPLEPASPPSGIKSFCGALGGAVYDQCQRAHVGPRDWERTVRIDVTGMSSLNFSLTGAEKEDLIRRGREGAKAFMARRAASPAKQRDEQPNTSGKGKERV